MRSLHPSLAGMDDNKDDGTDDTCDRTGPDEGDGKDGGEDPEALDRSGGRRGGSAYEHNWRQHLDRIQEENGEEWARFQAERAHLPEGMPLSCGRKSRVSDSTYLDTWAYSRALDDELVVAARAGWHQLDSRRQRNTAAWFPTLEHSPALYWLSSSWWDGDRQFEHPIIPIECVDEQSYAQSPYTQALLLPAFEDYEGDGLTRLRNTMIAAAWAHKQRRTEGDRPQEYLFVTLVYDREMTGASAGLEPFHGPSAMRALNSVYFCAWCEGGSGSTTNAETYNAHMRTHLGLAPICGQCFQFTSARQQDKFPDHFTNKCPQRHHFRF